MAKHIKKEKKKEFSKVLLIQESILVWIITIAFIALAAWCIHKGFTGSLPWLSTLSSVVWGAYGVSQAFYYNKAKSENTAGGIVYEKAIIDHKIENGIDLDYGV